MCEGRVVPIDLHTHSRAGPTARDRRRSWSGRGRRAGLDVVALTDHDTADGWAEAPPPPRESGSTLVRGIEISTRYDGTRRAPARLPAGPDVPGRSPPSSTGSARAARPGCRRCWSGCARSASTSPRTTCAAGRRRAPRSAGRTSPTRWSRSASSPTATRPSRRTSARGGPATSALRRRPRAHVDAGRRGGRRTGHRAPVGAAAGTRSREAALARPARRRASPASRSTTRTTRRRPRDELRGIARDLDLVVTGSSDYHGTGKVDHELGCNTTAPDAVRAAPASWPRRATRGRR